MTTASEYLSLNGLTPEDKAIMTDLQSRLGRRLDSYQDRWIMDRRTTRNLLCEPVCPDCGSASFTADGSCDWNMAAQDWEVCDVYAQRGFCGNCDGETYSTEVYYRRADPDGMNADRERWAEAAIQAFRREVGTDYEDALGDLLCDLMHWAHVNEFSFQKHLSRAYMHYAEEVKGERITLPIGTRAEEAAA